MEGTALGGVHVAHERGGNGVGTWGAFKTEYKGINWNYGIPIDTWEASYGYPLGWSLTLDLSYAMPTGDEVRPINSAVRYLVRATD